MTRLNSNTKPWDLLKTVSDIMGPTFQQSEFNDSHLEMLLAEQGFDQDDIENALDWIERVAMSGSLSDVIGMLQDQQENIRVANPLEVAYLSQSLWKRIETCRLKGLLSNDLYEKLLEDIRVIDTRDWEEEDVKIFLAELLNTIVPHTAQHDFMKILEGRAPEYYS
jgi:uncharacterized protein Smg (DUF494 family)